jgi:O-antigen ligase
MLLVVAVVFLVLRPREMKRLWPALLPALVVVHFALPGTIGALRQSFFPEGGLIADQSQNPGSRGQGRVADVAPTLTEFSRSPILGQGYGSRVVDGETPNAQILDNEWLATLLETGIAGAVAFLWLFVRSIRRLGRAARGDPSAGGWLPAALAASLTALAVGMLTFDAFSFIQVTLLLFIMLALGSVALAQPTPVLRTER